MSKSKFRKKMKIETLSTTNIKRARSCSNCKYLIRKGQTYKGDRILVERCSRRDGLCLLFPESWICDEFSYREDIKPTDNRFEMLIDMLRLHKKAIEENREPDKYYNYLADAESTLGEIMEELKKIS